MKVFMLGGKPRLSNLFLNLINEKMKLPLPIKVFMLKVTLVVHLLILFHPDRYLVGLRHCAPIYITGINSILKICFRLKNYINVVAHAR